MPSTCCAFQPCSYHSLRQLAAETHSVPSAALHSHWPRFDQSKQALPLLKLRPLTPMLQRSRLPLVLQNSQLPLVSQPPHLLSLRKKRTKMKLVMRKLGRNLITLLMLMSACFKKWKLVWMLSWGPTFTTLKRLAKPSCGVSRRTWQPICAIKKRRCQGQARTKARDPRQQKCGWTGEWRSPLKVQMHKLAANGVRAATASSSYVLYFTLAILQKMAG
mmetsp:Transcript_99893/g.177206  ORF Transcript_99893/g.177206 Transcript_99893/m.177206 type:complete len:218 (-) Transcript_99893:333-986(-)